MSELQDLRDRVAELEHALGLSAEIPHDVIPREILGDMPIGKPMVLRVIAMLLARPFLSKEGAYILLYGWRAEAKQPSSNSVNVFVSSARKALRSYDIQIRGVWGRGWYIDETDKAKLRAVIERLEAERLAA